MTVSTRRQQRQQQQRQQQLCNCVSQATPTFTPRWACCSTSSACALPAVTFCDIALRYNYSAAIASFRHALAIKPHDYR